MCGQERDAAAGPGETATGGDGEESESSLLRHGGTVCPAWPNAPADEKQVWKEQGQHSLLYQLNSMYIFI